MARPEAVPTSPRYERAEPRSGCSSLFLGPRWVGDLCPMPLPQPLRLFQQCMDDSSDVREAPSWGPLLFQDVVGLTQGFLGGGGGGAQVKCPFTPSPLGFPARHRGQNGRHSRGARSKGADRMALQSVGSKDLGYPGHSLGTNVMKSSCQHNRREIIQGPKAQRGAETCYFQREMLE